MDDPFPRAAAALARARRASASAPCSPCKQQQPQKFSARASAAAATAAAAAALAGANDENIKTSKTTKNDGGLLGPLAPFAAAEITTGRAKASVSLEDQAAATHSLKKELEAALGGLRSELAEAKEARRLRRRGEGLSVLGAVSSNSPSSFAPRQ